MKYWTELTGVEKSLIELDTLLSMVRTLSLAVESGAEYADVQNCIYLIEEKLGSINKNANADFQHLWEVVRNDSFREIENVINSETIEEMNKIINSWVNP